MRRNSPCLDRNANLPELMGQQAGTTTTTTTATTATTMSCFDLARPFPSPLSPPFSTGDWQAYPNPNQQVGIKAVETLEQLHKQGQDLPATCEGTWGVTVYVFALHTHRLCC